MSTLASHPAVVVAIVVFCGLATLAITPRLIRALTRGGILDVPGERSSHKAPVPRGGGLAIVVPVAMVFAGLNLTTGAGPHAWCVLIGLTLLAAVSWCDDRNPQPVTVRLFVQALAVTLPLVMLAPEIRILPPTIPLVVERAGLALAWMWFVNAFNFMDGLDGLATGQSVTASAGVYVIAGLAGMASAFTVAGPIAAGLAAGSLAFLRYNWHPARVFLGESGSIPIGYLLGWLLLGLALSGHIAAAIILPLYFITDASLTLVSRLFRGDQITRPHASHLYQRAHRGGKSHAWVATRILVANALLAGIACISLTFPGPALVAAIAVCASLWLILLRAARS